ncbi:prepilin peptidase [Isoptericola sp. NPDC056618]|uniref:prepilin peptidase n=1 Tax=Isoptericola sp. NPDC056618 TaxID=3345878 RepID=UPI0036BE7904
MPFATAAPTSVLVGAVAGLLAGVVLWRWLRTGAYRYDTDEPRSRLGRAWTVVPLAAAGGAVAGLVPWPLAAAAGVYLVGGAALGWIDLDVHRIPDAVTRVWGPLVALALGVPAAVAGDWAVLGRALGGALALGALFAVMAFFSMGLGDVKLAVVTGLVVGPLGVSGVVTALVATCAVAALMAVALLLRGAGRKTHLAYGPALVAGAAVALVVAA